MAENVNMGGFIATFITLAFVFSTMYTLAFYYYQGASTSYEANPMKADSDHDILDVLGIIGGILDFISWLSPFLLIKAFLVFSMQATPDLYQFLDMLILRPVGWIVVMLETNYIISKIPTMSGE